MLPLADNAPVRRLPVVTIGLIVANVLVFLSETGALERRVFLYGYYPCTVDGPCAETVPAAHLPPAESVFTGMFMHASWYHLAGNMLFLWIFGNNVEDVLGRVRFLLWYLAAGIAATAVQTVATLHESGNAVAAASIPNVGASGAIAGVLGAYLMILPFAGVRTWPLFFIRIPAVLVIGLWFFGQLQLANDSFVHPEAGGGVAFFAHVGGFLFGFLTIRLVKVRNPIERVRHRG